MLVPRVVLLSLSLGALISLGALLTGCPSRSGGEPDGGAPTPATSGSSGPVAIASASVSPAQPSAPVGRLATEGSVIARAAAGDALYIADEDHSVLRIVPLPLDPAKAGRAVPMPGPPAQILVLADQVLVTIRDPGLLVKLRPDAAAGLVEVARVALPSDAWGIGRAGDAVLVTSAWSHALSAVSLASFEKLWSIDVPREPRGVVFEPKRGVAYVTHLVGAKLTRIDDVAVATRATTGAGHAPSFSAVDLPASPIRAPSGRSLAASLGYSAALSADGDRLFVPRHALGALGKEAWFGAATVDVLLTANDATIAPKHGGKLPFLRADRTGQGEDTRLPGASLASFTEPRAIIYRRSTKTVLVVGEGDDRVVELDALAMDPTLAPLRTYVVGSGYDPVMPVAASGAAPQGIAISDDESTAWVFCRASYDVAEIHLDAIELGNPEGGVPKPLQVQNAPVPPKLVRLAEDPVDAFVGAGRRLFYNATDRITSGGVACAGCHPEGRDDGFVWHEAKFNSADGTNVNFVGSLENVPEEDHTKGTPRRTPMLAGRVGAAGPYGWHAESPTIEDRLSRGFGLHRWGAIPKHEAGNLGARAGYLIAFLRKGLRTPPREERALTDEEQRGRTIFASPEAKCSKCHVPESGYTDRTAYPFTRPPIAEFDPDPVTEFKTPSLLFVAGRAPYFHDGSASSLDELIERNADRMGKTSQLSKEDRAALLAFLRTL